MKAADNQTQTRCSTQRSVSLLLALTSLLMSRRSNRKWYVATVEASSVLKCVAFVAFVIEFGRSIFLTFR